MLRENLTALRKQNSAFFPFPLAELSVKSVKTARENLQRAELDDFSRQDIYTLIANRSEFCDALLLQLWRHFQFDQDENLSLLAVGGYGRQEMFPLSDLDFLILCRDDIEPKIEQKIADFVQFLWDCGFNVGQSVRTLTQCYEQAKTEISIATNLLESRLLYGDQALFNQLNEQLHTPDFWPIQAFYDAKLEEKNQRYQRYHNTSYNLEPDIKHSPGGLRDLHLICWIALRHNGAKNLAGLLQSGFIYPNEYEKLLKHQTFLFKVRFALHLFLKRYDNRLLFDRQLKISELLNFSGSGNQGVEKMMKRYFQAVQSIAQLSNLLLKYFHEHFLSPSTSPQFQPLDAHFLLAEHNIYLQNQYIFQQYPHTILDLFHHLCADEKRVVHSSTLRHLYLALDQMQGFLCEQPLAREKFIRLFAHPFAIKRALLPMHQYGVLNHYLPQWHNIQGLMQFDLFHSYTVDEHSLRVMLEIEHFINEDNRAAFPICYQIMHSDIDRTLLYLTALFHDIAKGQGGDHSELGAKEIAKFAYQHNFNQREIHTMAWLVQQHLLMSTTAQRRDIYDPNVVQNFAEQVQNGIRLDYLLCLTIADIRATNNTLWNSWKASLFSTLYQYCDQQFKQGIHRSLDFKANADKHRLQALKWVAQSRPELTEEDIQQFWRRCPEQYFLRHTPQQLQHHIALLVNFSGNIKIKVSNRFTQGGTEIFLYCQDQPNLFHNIVSVIGAKKLSIHSAQIITSLDGYVFDTFIVTELNGEPLKFERRRQIEQAILQRIQQKKVPKFTALQHAKHPHFTVPTEIRFLSRNTPYFTEMELFTRDHPGLLAEVSQVFSQLNLNLLNAKITTIGEKVQDLFILSTTDQQALDEQQKNELEQCLLAVLRD